MAIQALNLRREFEKFGGEIMPAIERVCRSAEFIRGKEVSNFEARIARYLGNGYAVGCASGTDALQLALMALDIGKGDQVITTPFTFGATAEVISLLGAEPVFADIDPYTYNIDPDSICDLITSRTKAIMPVHLFGQSADMDSIMTIAKGHDLKVIEDCAQSLGAMYKGQWCGAIGDIGCFSFFPSKNLGCYGDGGMVFSKDENLIKQARIISNHGCPTKYAYERIGVNSRLDTIQAAILNVKKNHLDAMLAGRRRIADLYNERLFGLGIMTPVEKTGNKHTYNQYCIEVNNRDALAAHLKSCEISTAVYYPSILPDNQAYMGCRCANMNRARAICGRILALPCDPLMEDNEIAVVTDAIKDWLLKT